MKLLQKGLKNRKGGHNKKHFITDSRVPAIATQSQPRKRH